MLPLLPRTFTTTTERGLDRQSPPMRLFEKAKKFGIWNPSEIDFVQDREHWLRMSDAERDVILRLTALFQAGEEAVTLDLLPLIMVIAREGRIEEEMFLTTFLWEEAKHTDFFRRFLDEVAQTHIDLAGYHTGNYRRIVYEALPTALERLLKDPSPAAQVRASVTYNMIVEGVLAETGYHAYKAMLERHQLMPGQRQGITYLKQDESRHIAYGVYLISRLIAADPALWEVADETMNMLLMPALGVVEDVFAQYNPAPFGLQQEEFIQYALMQFQKRYLRLQAARSASMEEIRAMHHQAIENDDG